MDNQETFLGNESVVEIDETLIAKKRKYNRGRVVNQQWLFGAIERDGEMAFVKTVDRRDSATLGRLIKEHINESATVYSDEWAAYVKFFGENLTYEHNTVNHSNYFVNTSNPVIHTQTIESFWGVLKRWIRTKNYSRREYLEYYLAEFLFRRFKKNLKEFELFELIVKLILDE